ncbi:MAG: bifunctional folylpolyglutamate synthase/dihydrofolate synthase [Deltaproteobacteria bacterium]|nr:bifunctional folylpolyglutamate synthase/dihydrofolate synthase [Deltaproteobacteria bacterium]
MRALLARLGDPQRSLRVIHIAGTKGKGSTAAIVERVARAHGWSTGLTTSPHLSCTRERILLDGVMIGERAFAELEHEVHEAAAVLDDAPSFFEQVIAMALLAFARRRVDVAVVEVGLGGRLDATNVVQPAVTGITRLGLDHTEHLGPTLEHIAREKAGIFKRGVPALSVPQDPAAAAVLVEAARAADAPLTFVPPDPSLEVGLAGRHQRENATLALALLVHAGFARDEAATRRGLRAVRWPGRYETARRAPTVLLDGAHNETSARALVEVARADAALTGRPLFLVVGMTSGHDPRAFAEALAPLVPRRVTAVASRSPRTYAPEALARALARTFGVCDTAPLVEALACAMAAARRAGGAVLVTGSLYLVGEVRHRLLGGPADPQLPLF